MFLEIKGKPWIPLELGQLYLLGTQINVGEERSNYFIELEEEEGVSQRHCVIETNQNAEVFVFDLFSSKGTLLNNKILNSLEKTLLSNGDVLRFGKNEIKYVHDGHDVLQDSSGFLDANKNKSGATSSSPDSTSLLEHSANFLVPSVPLKRLDTSASSSTTTNRRSDSFTIPETQYCRSRTSNGSNISIAESVPDNNDGKVAFNFGNLDSFEGDDDFCIPETQDLLDAADKSTKRASSVLSESKGNCTLEEMPSKGHADGSQFRICTQDYNEGFGEEETDGHLHSQIIPIIKHQTVNLNNTKWSNENLNNRSTSIEEDIEMFGLKTSNAKIDQGSTESRTDCPTPDIFDFNEFNESNKNQQDIDKPDTKEDCNFLDDEEDLLPTQVLPPVRLNSKVPENNLNEPDKPCFEIEHERIITSSDKENRCPVGLEPMSDLPPTQLFEVPTPRSHVSISNPGSAIKTNLASGTEKNSSLLLNIIPDEDDLLTQVLLHPASCSTNSNRSPSKSIPDKCLNSTLVDDKSVQKNPVTFFAEIEKTPLKKASCSPTLFKIPEKDLGVLKKTASATSSTSENDLDLLMCTPQLIKDNLFLGKTEDFKKNILAVKNRNLFGDDSDEEDSKVDDDQSDLVKLINIPRQSSDFEKLLPHLNKKAELTKMNKEEMVSKEAQKSYKFSISFGKEMDEKQSKASTSKSSALSRDERHAARDKVKESSRPRGRPKIKDEVQSNSKEINKASKTPARRMTRSKSKLFVISPIDEKEDLDSIATQPIVKATRSRTKSDQNESQDCQKPNTSSNKNISNEKNKTDNNASSKRNERKRGTDPQPAAEPVKIERKRLRSTDSLTTSSVTISMTMVDQELFKNLFNNSKGLWNIAKNCSDSDVLVMDKPYRTFKFLLSVARGIPIVTSKYLKKLNETKSVKEVLISDYLFADKEFEKKYNFSLVKSLEAARKLKVLKGYEFLMTASILPTPQEIKTIIETAGGSVHDKTPPKPKENQELYLVTSTEDKKDWHKYRRINKNINIVSTEAIMATIMNQKILMNNYRLS